ncbi:MAG: hypothetical protein AAGB25_08700, partial [Pseudomonadota bacterium]
ETVSPGIVKTAQIANAPIMVYAVASAPAKRLNTWDRFLLPLPFGKGAVVFDGPINAPKDADPEAVRLELETRMRAAYAKAEALAGLAPIDAPQTAKSSSDATATLPTPDTVPK